MKRSRLKNIINKSKSISNKQEVGNPFDEFKKSLPIEIDDNYRLEAAWKAYGSPKDYKTALWNGMIQPIDETNVKLPSIGYNEETDEYEYLNKGEDNETVAKDIRVWDNDVIPLVKELKLGGFIRVYDEEKDCWKYSKNKSQDVESFKLGGKKKIKIYLEGDSKEGEYIEVDSLDDDQRAGRKPIGKDSKGRNRYLNGDNKAVLNQGGRQNGDIPGFQKGGKPKLDSKETGEDPIGYLNDGTPLYKKGDGTIGPLTKENIGKDNLFDLIKNSNASWAKRLQDPNRKYITYPNGSIGNFKLTWSEDETGTIVYPEIQEIDGQLVDLSEDPEKAWKSAIEHKDYIYFPSNDAADWFTKNYKNYYKGFDKTPQAFKQGGQMSVIPEGALHARKNGMELAEKGEITSKGIPVVDNEGEQQAEIEKEEIIFSKSVTDKVEDLFKKYESDETSQSEKDNIAIKMGKIITCELMTNTDDRTGLIEDIANDRR